MTFRVSALVTAATVMALGYVTPPSAQPQAPVRPRTNTFGTIFTPGLQQQQQQQQLLLNQAFGGVGPGVGGGLGLGQGGLNPAFLGGGALGYPGQLAYPQALPGALGVNPQLPQSGIVGSFNNYGHWYGQRSGNYGHWYPNRIANGRGVLGNSGGYGGGFGGGISGGAIPSGGALNSLGGTAAGVGATLNQLRR